MIKHTLSSRQIPLKVKAYTMDSFNSGTIHAQYKNIQQYFQQKIYNRSYHQTQICTYNEELSPFKYKANKPQRVSPFIRYK